MILTPTFKYSLATLYIGVKEKNMSLIEVVPKWDRNCKNNCGSHGYRWGSLGGYCTNCKHTANVGCKCILNGCGKIYWAKTMAQKRLANKRGRA